MMMRDGSILAANPTKRNHCDAWFAAAQQNLDLLRVYDKGSGSVGSDGWVVFVIFEHEHRGLLPGPQLASGSPGSRRRRSCSLACSEICHEEGIKACALIRLALIHTNGEGQGRLVGFVTYITMSRMD